MFRGQAGGVAWGFCPPLRLAVCAGGMYSTLLLLLASCFCSRLLKNGSWVFLVSL